MLEESKDPLAILEVIHDYSQIAFLQLMEQIKTNKISRSEVDFFEEIFIFSNYKHFMFNLIEASAKRIDQYDFDKLLMAKAKRGKETSELLIKRYNEMDKAK